MEKANILIERRQSPRLRVACEAELFASVSLLDTSETDKPSSSLVFLGATQNISLAGVALTLPSMKIDEKYCQEAHSLKVSLHLKPSSSVELEISPLRCQPLNANDPDAGYLIGARITRVGAEGETEFKTFLQSVNT